MGGGMFEALGDANAAQQPLLLLAKALRVGVVLDFLPLSDVVVLLTACSSALRNDVELTQAALLESSPAARHGRHLLQECWNDWFALVPKRIVGDEALAAVCCDTTHYEDDDPGRYMRIKDPVRHNYYHSSSKNKMAKARYPRSYFAQLLSVVGAFDRFVLPACADKQLFLSSYGDYTATIPMAISLWDYYQPQEQQQRNDDDGCGAVKWTRESVREALNAVHTGFGDRFTDNDRENAYVSQFGAHWDSIRVTKGGDDHCKATCELCEMRKTVVQDYEAQVQRQQEECSAAIAELMHSEEVGEQGGVGNQDELDKKIESIERQFFPEANDDDDPYLQEGVEDVLGHVVNSEKVHFPPFPAGKGLSSEDLFACLQDVYGYPVQCRSVSQPLKRFFTTRCQFANRIKYDWIPRQAFATSHAYRCTKIELVGGVTPSGFFCGAFVVILQTL